MKEKTQENFELFLGRNCCLAIWHKRPQLVQGIYILKSSFGSSAEGLQLIAEAKARNIEVHFLAKGAQLEGLFDLAPSEKECLCHQGVAMLAPKRKPNTFDAWLSEEKFALTPLVPFLDGVARTMNISMFARSCAHFGLTSILMREDCLSDLGSEFGRYSAGTIEEVDIITYQKIAPTLESLKKCNYEVVTLSPHVKKSLYNYSFSPKTVFILGAEREGVSDEALSAADTTLSLPSYSKVADSLNVATMGAIFLYEYNRQQVLKQVNKTRYE